MLKILVADDDRRMVGTISDILRIKGYEVVPAWSGEEAVEKTKSEKPDCVLMDIKMPGISGVEALKMIKSMTPNLPVVLMSAFAAEEQIAEGKKLGASAVLTKPFDFQMLLSFLAVLRKEKSILIVDDDPLFCKTLKDILQLKNFKVDTEMDPEKVLGDMEKEYKLVVVLDVKLGDADGLDVLKAIRDRYPSKPVILVTAYRQSISSAIEKGLQIGAHTCLYKPLEIEWLIKLIEEISVKKKNAVLGENR